MSRRREASLEAKMRIHALEKKIEELEDFKTKIELGQKWLLCAFGIVGTIVATAAYVVSIIKDLNIKFG